jgi:hypothetical protein
MSMTFFGNIFISSYRIYKKLEKNRDPRFTSSALVSFCFIGILFMAVVLFLRINNIPNSKISVLGNYPFLTICFALIEMFIAYKYFSEKRIIALNNSFEQKKLIERRIWGFVTIITLIAPMTIGAILFNK